MMRGLTRMARRRLSVTGTANAPRTRKGPPLCEGPFREALNYTAPAVPGGGPYLLSPASPSLM